MTPAGERQFQMLDTPPSLNRVGSRGALMSWHRAKKKWQREIEQWLMVCGLPRNLDHVDAYVSMRFPVRRRRDTGNFSALIEKALGDALVNGGWLPDDTADRFALKDLRFEDQPGNARTTVTLVYNA